MRLLNTKRTERRLKATAYYRTGMHIAYIHTGSCHYGANVAPGPLICNTPWGHVLRTVNRIATMYCVLSIGLIQSDWTSRLSLKHMAIFLTHMDDFAWPQTTTHATRRYDCMHMLVRKRSQCLTIACADKNDLQTTPPAMAIVVWNLVDIRCTCSDGPSGRGGFCIS